MTERGNWRTVAVHCPDCGALLVTLKLLKLHGMRRYHVSHRAIPECERCREKER